MHEHCLVRVAIVPPWASRRFCCLALLTAVLFTSFFHCFFLQNSSYNLKLPVLFCFYLIAQIDRFEEVAVTTY